jgi:hypothetical protein
MPRVPTELREYILAFWRGHSEAWKLSGLTQRAYCEQQGISLKNFGGAPSSRGSRLPVLMPAGAALRG